MPRQNEARTSTDMRDIGQTVLDNANIDVH